MTMVNARFNLGFVNQAARRAVSSLERLALVVAPPVLRIALAVPFFRSGLTRWDGFLSLSPSAAYLFEEEFKLHIFGGTYDVIRPFNCGLLSSLPFSLY